jgi:uncharacterized membrane protein
MTAVIPEIENEIARPAGTRFEPSPRGTITRAVTIMRPRAEVRDAWMKMEYPEDASFSDAPGGRGTVVMVVIPNADPKTALGSAFAMLRGDSPADKVAEGLRRFKAQVETGEIPTIDGQPTGKRS